MGNTSGGLTATDVAIANHLDPHYWYQITNKTVKDLAGGSIGPRFDKLLRDYVPNYQPPPEEGAVNPAGVSNPEEDKYPDEDDDTYGESGPPSAKRAKGGGGLLGAAAGGAGAAIAAAAGGHHNNPPPPPPAGGEQQHNPPDSAVGNANTRTSTVTETEEEPDMESGGSAEAGGAAGANYRQTPPGVDITEGPNGNLICKINIERKVVFESDPNPYDRYHMTEVDVHTCFPLVKKKDEEGNKTYTHWKLNLVDSGWKTLDFNSWSNWMNFPLYNFLVNEISRMRIETFKVGLRNIYTRDVNQDQNNKTVYELTEDGRLQLIVDHTRYIPYYSSTGFAPFGRCPHTPFTPWNFFYPVWTKDKLKSEFYYFENHPFVELLGQQGTDVAYCFERGHWKDFRLFKSPLFYRGHRWFKAVGHNSQLPYTEFNLGPEIGIEGANWNSIEEAKRENHPSMVDYNNNSSTDVLATGTGTPLNKTPIQGPNDYFNFSEKQEEKDDFYQYNDTEHSFLKGKSKGNWHDGWGQRTQQYIEDSDTKRAAQGAYQVVDEELVNWKLPSEGFGTHGLTFVMNGPVWHEPHQGVAYSRGLAACSPIPDSPPQMFCRIKDQYLSESTFRKQIVNFDIFAELTLELERHNYFNPCVFNQVCDRYTTIPGGVNYEHKDQSGTTGMYDSPLQFWRDADESRKVFQGNIYYPQ